MICDLGHKDVCVLRPRLQENQEALADYPLCDETTFVKRVTHVLVLGGDGTLIYAASLFQDRIVPILGVHVGHVGFLNEVRPEKLQNILPHVLQGALLYDDRMRLRVSLLRQNVVLCERNVLNDAVLSIQALARIGTYRLTCDTEPMTLIRGDGVIVSTPTGSTAYALAAGGSVLVPNVEVIAITPICSHQLNQRQLVVSPSCVYRFEVMSESAAFLTLDGQYGHPLEQHDVVEIHKASVPTRLMRVPEQSYFETLRTKLHWGHMG